jgi:site-specific DNA recombinase
VRTATEVPRRPGHPPYEGRHERLVSQELFDEVQAVLACHKHSGERDRKHLSYLKGTIRCASCASQLVYSRHKGNGGTYEYFVCPKNQRGRCPQGYQPVDLVEQAVEDHYATVGLTPDERDRVRETLTKDLSDRIALAQQEVERCQGVLEQIKERERKLLHMHYEGRISDELFDDEQATLRRERHETETLMSRLSLNHDDAVATLDLALQIIESDIHDLYRRGDETIRRLLNQALFKALYIEDEQVVEQELTEPFLKLRALHTALTAAPSSNHRAQLRSLCPGNAKGADPYRGRTPFRVGSISEHLVRMRGLEPPRSRLHTDLNRARLPIPPHPLAGDRQYRTGRDSALERCARG